MDGKNRRELLRDSIALALAGLGPVGIGGCRETPPDGPPGNTRGDGAGHRAGPGGGGEAPSFEPAYLALHRNGELKRRGELLWRTLQSCRLCPRECGAARLDGRAGFCGASARLDVSSHYPHRGEEQPLSGTRGSGTVFLTHCGLRCVFCINWEVSHGGQGTACRVTDLAAMMLELQGRLCHNLNLVTPTHYAPHILLALDEAAGKGLRLPVVYNTCGWERLEVLKLLDGVVDVYLPDFKYADGRRAERYSAGAAGYPEVTQAALLEMQRQVGTARPGADGLVRRGLMIRHLVMPGGAEDSIRVVDWVADHLPADTYLNLMSQYTPVFKARDYPEIDRRITRAEYHAVVQRAKDRGLTNLDIQGYPR